MRKIILGMTMMLICHMAASAAERVTLQNGSPVPCHHHALVEGQMRLYLTAGDQNYIAVAPERVVSIEVVPDEPPAITPVQAAVSSSTPSTALSPALVSRKTVADGRLTQADLNEMLSHAGQAHNVDMDLLASVVKVESGGNPRAKSRAGARGLMQLMPKTAADMGVSDSFKPDENVQGGSAYLDALLVRYHDNIALALAAYNAGPAAVDKYHGIPPYHETRVYVAYVIHEFNRRVRARAAQAKMAAQTAAKVEGPSAMTQ